ncbi:UPF0175 family protein, partial [Candidatus Micrarchaeota archaeon]|nr:UPF0175 family protein [Candidatus Micrarchaeota archaeon]
MQKKQIINELSDLQKVIVLLLEADSSKPIPGNTWYQKELFLIGKNLENVSEEATFEPDFFGPFSENAEEQLSDLEQEDFVDREGNKIKISKDGKELAKEIKKEFDKKILELIEEFKKLLNDLNEEELLTFIYFNFPQTTSESQVREKIIKNRIKNAISLYKKSKISLSKASEIAGMPIEKLKKMGAKAKKALPESVI